MATLHRHTFTVEGSGRFPIDMLRYDSCYPASQADVSAITNDGGPGQARLEPRRVELAHTDTRKRWTPTSGRWESFGWRVLCCEHY